MAKRKSKRPKLVVGGLHPYWPEWKWDGRWFTRSDQPRQMQLDR